MLTREQALTKYCPHKFPVTAVAGIIAGLMPDSEELIAAISCNCTANDCPKWIDYEDDSPCGQAGCEYRDNITNDVPGAEDGPNQCQNCPHRYGRCGG